MERRSLIIYLVLAIVLAGCTREQKITTSSPEALRCYNEGVDRWKNFYYQEAKSVLDSAISLDSTFAMAWARLALVDEGMRNEAQSKLHIERARRYSSNASRREQLFINMWYHKINYTFKEAVTAADSLIALSPEDAEAHAFRGIMYEEAKDFEAAIRSYERATKVDTGYAPAVMSLGYAYSTMGEQSKAIAQMKRYIRMAPTAADPRASYADLLLRVGMYEEALSQYTKSLELKPDYWYSINQIGNVYIIQGRLREAEEQFHKGLTLLLQSQQLESSHLSADATLNVLRGDYPRAIEQYIRALTIDSTNSGPAYGLVNAFIQMKKFKEADATISRIRVELDRRNLGESQAMLGFFLARARFLTAQGQLMEALAVCDSALDHSSPLTRGVVYRQVAEIRLEQRQYEDAFDACEEALRANPNNPDALLTLMKVYHAKGDLRMTHEIGGRLLEFWKNADADFRHLGDVKKMLAGNRSGVSA